MADSKVAIEIVLEDDKVIKGFARIGKKAGETEKKVNKSFSQRLFKGFGKNVTNSVIGPLAAATAGLVAAGTAAFTFSRALAAASAQDDAINQLNQSLAAAGTFSEATSQDIQDFASSLQQVTTIGDETTLQMVALAQNFTTTADEAKELTAAAVDLSAATGMSLDSAVRNLGKTYAGLAGELGESIPQLRNLTQEQLKSGAAIELVQTRFAGFASSLRNTFSGSVAAFNNAFGDFLERLGQLVTQSPVLIRVIGFISDKFVELSKSLAQFGDQGDVVGEIIIKVIQFGQTVNKFLIMPVELAVKAVRIGFNTILGTLSSGLQLVLNQLGSVASFFSSDLGAKFKMAGEAAGLASADAFDTAITVAQTGFQSSFSDSIANVLTQTEQVAQAALESGETVGKSFSAGLDKGLKPVDDSLVQLESNINKALQQGVLNVVTQGIAGIAGALVTGADAFGTFQNIVLGILGDFAIQIGGLLIAQGLAIEALKTALLTLNGGAAIAAGAALIALGGALKALSSGPSPGGASTAGGGAAAGGGLAGGGAAPEGGATDETLGLADEVEEQRQATVINLNIDRAIGLDDKGLGVALAEQLQDSFDQEGVEVRQGAFA